MGNSQPPVPVRRHGDEILRWARQHAYTPSKRGQIVLAAPGIGKTTFVRQHKAEWVDADDIMKDLGAHDETWHNAPHDDEEEEQHYKRCDVLLAKMKVHGFRVIGSLFSCAPYHYYQPDAIITLNETIHKQYVEHRPDLNWPQVKRVRDCLSEMAEEKNIPEWGSIAEYIEQLRRSDRRHLSMSARWTPSV